MNTQLFRIGAVFIFAISSALAWSTDLAQHKITDGIDVYYGVVPIEVVQSHMKQHGEAPMHGKTNLLTKRTYHLVITLYDAKTAQRINDAKVSATVTPLGLAPETKTLDVMQINDTISYGNYFSMSPSDSPYRILVFVKRPTDRIAITTEFEYRHGVSR